MTGAPQGAAWERGDDNGFFWVPWTWIDAVGAFGISVLAGLVLGTVLVLAGGARGGAATTTTAVLILGQVTLAAAVLAWVGARFRSDLWRLRGPRGPSWRVVRAALGFGVLTYLVVNLGLGFMLEMLVEALGRDVPTIQEPFREALADPAQAPVFLASAVLLAPAAEELFFRGLLFQGLRARIGVWPAIGVSSAFFGLSHLGGTSALGNAIVFVVTAVLGAAFAWSFERFGTLLAPVLVHGVVNLGTSVLLLGQSA